MLEKLFSNFEKKHNLYCEVCHSPLKIIGMQCPNSKCNASYEASLHPNILAYLSKEKEQVETIIALLLKDANLGETADLLKITKPALKQRLADIKSNLEVLYAGYFRDMDFDESRIKKNKKD